MNKNKKQVSGGLSRRLHFPEDEQRLPWLSTLLDAYSIVDTGVAIAIRDAEKKERKRLACGKGCGTCCIDQKDLPLYPHEIVGIYWYASEKMTNPLRDVLKSRLATRLAASGCPFLIDNSCSIHPVRPFGCRQFNVFSVPCAPGEDPYFTRRDDVLKPIPAYLDRAFTAVIPLYSGLRKENVSGSIKIIRGQIMNLLTYDWSKLVNLMEKGDATYTSS